MKRFSLKPILFFFILLIVFSCAKRGRIGGGEKDTTPPVIVRSIPENYSVNFDNKEIKIYFDEYVKLKDIQKQLIISPPLKYDPIITPLGTPSKYITIKIQDTLPENTTFTVNFGQSIVDNNEENPYPFFKYVFSTGDFIDSLNVKGTINDAVKLKPEQFVSVMLYKIDSTFSDSIIYKEKPTYITNTLDSINIFQIENLKAGKYLLMALKEETTNYIYNPKTDKIGFLKEYITVPTDSIYNIVLFNEELPVKAGKPKFKSLNKLAFGYEGDHKKMKINLLSDTPSHYKSLITKQKDLDSLNYWFKPTFEQDSLIFEVTDNLKYRDTFTVKLRKKLNDSLSFNGSRGDLRFYDHFKISANNPIVSYNKDLIKILDKDSSEVTYNDTFDELSNTLELSFEVKEQEKYKVTFLPEAMTDFFENKNDTLAYNLTTRTYADYGNVRVRLKNAPDIPLIVQLTDEKGKVFYELPGKANELFDFRYINPSKYYLRVLFDENGNGKYDTGDFLKKIQPERISYNSGQFDVRPNWDSEQKFILKD
ncbi:MAG: Ig-like domain-containing protein [Flavobacteriaceae bacterium]|nr:Ig-like domain-containing protein [Flavobacteriaceae bacterium]